MDGGGEARGIPVTLARQGASGGGFAEGGGGQDALQVEGEGAAGFEIGEAYGEVGEEGLPFRFRRKRGRRREGAGRAHAGQRNGGAG